MRSSHDVRVEKTEASPGQTSARFVNPLIPRAKLLLSSKYLVQRPSRWAHWGKKKNDALIRRTLAMTGLNKRLPFFCRGRNEGEGFLRGPANGRGRCK